MVRGRDACWEHCVLIDATRQKVRCNYCHREFSGGVYRMKFHLAQIKNKDIVPCSEVPNEVRDLIQNIVSTPKKHKNPKKPKLDLTSNGEQHSSSASDEFHPNPVSSGQYGSTCQALLFPSPSPSTQPTVDDPEKKKHDDADKKIALFFFQNSIPFSASRSTYYQEMVDAVAECGVGYEAPSYEKLRSSLLDKVKGEISDNYSRYREEWKDTGCTILADCWSDNRTTSLVVFSITCPKGTLFLKSVDVSTHADDAHYLFELLESVVLEVGVENVVQVITDSSASYVYAGRLLMSKYTSLFWSPCASYCIDKMLEDMSKQEWISEVLEDARAITRYIYSHPWIVNTMRKCTGGKDLIRPKITRFVTNFLSLRSIVVQEDNLKHMFSDTELLSYVYSRRPDAQAVKSLLYLEKFWKLAQEAVNVSEPLVKLLRIIDGDMPAMGYVYEGIDRAKTQIKAYYKGFDGKYLPIWDIIDRRWNLQLQSPLHAAAAFLNPSIFYNQDYKIDMKMRNGFQEAMVKMITEDKDKIQFTKEHPMYINAHGALGSEFAILGRTLNSPGDWWAGYGYEVPTLQRAAIRILCQPCSSYWCKWNWSTFENMHTKKRNTMEHEKFNDLVFVHCNLRLQAVGQNREVKCRPVIFDEIDVSHEWPTESDSSSLLLDDSWLDNLPFEGGGSPSMMLSWCWEQSKYEYSAPALILSVLLVAITWWKLSLTEIPPPPGPWGLPLVGNLPFLDPDLHTCFAKLSLKYGPVMKVKLGSRVSIVISSPEAAKEVLNDHDVNFADRDVPAVALISTYGALNIAFAAYGEHWRMMRKVFVRDLFSHGRLKALNGLRQREVRDMLNKVHSTVGSSVDIGEHVLIAMFNITTSMMWGNTLNGEEKHRVTAKFREVSKTMVELIGEANISDFFPLLARFDIQGKERRMKKVFVWFDQIFEFVIGERRKLESEVEDAAHTKEDKQQNKDFLQLLLELIDQEDQKTPFTVTHLKALFGDLMVAGTKTTSTTVEWAMAELLNHPEIMKRAREELDQVVGLNNVVGETHLSKLPYLNAIIKEVFRLHPAGPLLIPRRSRESCIVGGYLIPKGAKIFVNVWAIQRDPKHWNGPLEFRPERFLESGVEWDFSGKDHRYMPFGSGRRICVAAPITENTVCWLLASLLHSFDWKLPEGVKLNMDEQFGIELQKKITLLAVPTPRLFDSKLYQ